MEYSDIIIIGAGLSGLCLAQMLTQENMDFLVLEGRERIGGRIKTIETNDGTTVEMGATWFFPHFQNLLRLMTFFNIESTEQYMKGFSFYQSNHHTPRKIYSQDGDGMYRIKGGTNKIINALYNNIDERKVFLSHAVIEIRRVEDGVQIFTTNGKMFKCHRVITTIPPQLLIHSINFSPSMLQEQKTIFNNTHTWMGEAGKVAISYQLPFWKEAGLSGTLYSHSGPLIQMHDQSSSDGTKHALVGFLDSETIHLTLDERKIKVINQLVNVFGKSASEYLDYQDTIWPNEAFTIPADAPELCRHQNNGHPLYQQPLWDGRLIIGGSETSVTAGGFMEGAVSSAKHIVKLLKE